MNAMTSALAITALSFPSLALAQSTTHPLDPSATFLRVNGETTASTLPIPLNSLGIVPGQLCRIGVVGDFDNGPGGDTNYGMIAVFSASATLLGPAVVRRVADALPTGVPIVSPPTWRGSLPTDFPEDFNVSVAPDRRPSTVEVPAGATHLFVCAWDSLYFDNSDPDGDFGVQIEVIGPGTWTDLGNGLPGVAGTPTLAGNGPLIGGSQLTLDITGARPTSPSILLLGFNRLDAPFFGGVLVPNPQLSITTATDAFGADRLTLPLLLRLAQGTELYFQYWTLDPAATSGLAATNAVSGTTP